MAIYKGGRECNYNVWLDMESSHAMSDSFPESQSNRDWNGRLDRTRKDWHERYKDFIDDDEREWADYEDRRSRFQNDGYKRHFRGGDERRPRDRSESRRSYSYSPPYEEKSHDIAGSSRESRHRSRGWDYVDIRDRSEDRNWRRHREPGSPTGSSDMYYGRESRRKSRVWDDEEEMYNSYYSKEKDSRSSLSNENNSFDYRNNGINNSRHAEEKNYRALPPSNTIIIRGLIQSITENDIWQAIIETNIIPSDIRLIRKKCTGEIRGFAFVSFDSVEEAIRFIDLKQGFIMLRGKHRALVEFSMPKVPAPKYDGTSKAYRDWTCNQCGFTNFKNRDVCFKCKEAHNKSSSKDPEDSEVSHYPTQTVLLKSLDVLSTEESVLQSLTKITSVPIRNIRIAHDPLTKTSLGVCYIEMHSVLDSVKLFNALTAEPFIVDGKKIQVSYRKIIPVQKSIPVAPAPPDPQSQSAKGDTKAYSVEDIPSLAEYSASLYAKTPQEHAAYLQYYTQYYKNQMMQGETTTETVSNISKPAEISTQAYTQTPSKETENTNLETQSATKTFPFVAEGSTQLPQYPVPDVSTYKYDKTSGYYYDTQTGLYYDASSQYYYNATSQQFLYWDSEKLTYLPVPTSSTDPNASKDEGKKDQEKNNKQDKIKVAKKIVKDMERWAKILNQKRDTAKQNIVAAPSVVAQPSKSVGSADAGFSVLERQESFTLPVVAECLERSPVLTSVGLGLSLNYEREEPKLPVDEVEELTNWAKLACLLCKRQFQSRESLIKHQQESTLHKTNLQKLRQSQGGSSQTFSLQPQSDMRKGATKSFALQKLEQYSES